MQSLPYPFYLTLDDGGHIRFTTRPDYCRDNVLALFSLHDLVKLHFLLLQFKSRDAIFLLEAGGTGFLKSRKNCIQGDHWCIGIGLIGVSKDGMRASLSTQWFKLESRRVSYRVNPDVRIWITWPVMRSILTTLDDDVYAILERENHVEPRRFASRDDPMLQALGPSSANIAYIKAVCASMFMAQPLPVPRSFDQLCTAIEEASKKNQIASRATKIPKDQYGCVYKLRMEGTSDANISLKYGVSAQSVRRTMCNIGEFVYKCREHAWHAWDLLLEEAIENYHKEGELRTL